MQVRGFHSIIQETFQPQFASFRAAVADSDLAPALRGDIPELGPKKAPFRLLRGSVGKHAATDSTRVRTVLSPGMLGDFRRQVLVEGLTQTAATTGTTTHDYLVLDGKLDVMVGDTVYKLHAGDRLVVPKGERQQVVSGDADNQVLVSYIAADMNRPTLLVTRLMQPEIESGFCGKLRNTLFQGIVSGVDQVVANGLTHSVGHVHQKFTEDYLVTRGWIRLALYDSKSETIEVIELRAGDRVLMPPGTGHKVLAGSADNRIHVTCVPGFHTNDETLCEPLERFGRHA